MRSKRKYRGERSKVSRKRTYRKRTYKKRSYKKRTYKKRSYKKRSYKKTRVNKRILQRGGSPIQTFAEFPGRGDRGDKALAGDALRRGSWRKVNVEALAEEEAREHSAPTRYPHNSDSSNYARVSRWLGEAHEGMGPPHFDPGETQLQETRRREEAQLQEAQRSREALERVAREQEALGRLSSLVLVHGKQCWLTHDLSSGITEIFRKYPTKEQGTEAVVTFDFSSPYSSFALDTNNPKRLTLDNSVSRNSLLFDDEVTCVKFLDAFRSRKASVSFRIEKLLGEGQGGRVFKVRQMGGKYNSCHYAMKSISKNGEKECAVRERDFLEEITKKRVPFVVRMHYSFQDRENLYMGIDYLTRGDLAHHISLAPRKSGIPQIKTYAAQIVLAIEGLHEIGIVHRDLKAENIGIDARDNAILLDFGHSARGSEGTSRLEERCCTLENMAPEVLTRKGEITYGKAVDWWGLGTIIYEMRYTERPFPGPIEPDYIEQITHELPSRSIARSFFGGLLIRLLEKTPEERLTNPKEIKASDFFSGINWSKLLVEGTKVHPPVNVIYDEYSFLDQEYKDYSEAPINKTITMNAQSDKWEDDFHNFKFNVFYGYDDL